LGKVSNQDVQGYEEEAEYIKVWQVDGIEETKYHHGI
jgi:hypothetical protein